jgi:hypothetical protein
VTQCCQLAEASTFATFRALSSYACQTTTALIIVTLAKNQNWIASFRYARVCASYKFRKSSSDCLCRISRKLSVRGEQHLRSTGLRFGRVRRILSWTGYPTLDAPGDEGAESVELVEATEEMEDLSPWLDLLDDIELAADEFVSSLCSSEGV